jgi:exopolysaccharide biosynthesis polyprenyl glycosylphosphotransferase
MTKPADVDTIFPRPLEDSLQARRPARLMQFRVSERRLLLRVGDITAIILAVLIALWLWADRAHEAFTAEFILRQVYWFFVLPALWLLLATANDYYDLRVAARLSSSLWRLTQITVQFLIVYLAVFFLSAPGSLPRLFIIYYAVASLLLTMLWRGCRLFLIGWTGFRRRAIIVGTGHEAEIITRALTSEAADDYDVLGYVCSNNDTAPLFEQGTYLGTGVDLPALVSQYGASELVMAYVNAVPDDVFRGITTCYERGIEIVSMPMLFEQITGRVPVEQISEHLWVLVLPGKPRGLRYFVYKVMKRLIDICFAIAGLLLFAPIFPFLALAIKVNSRGPVFYRQDRTGQGGQPFRLIKLRSMVAEAERDTGPRWAATHDPRVTRVGLFLRRSRLDEIPQLLNVLKGDMSLVGPRPERPVFVEALAEQIPYYRSRLSVKPGLTGWAQVRFRYANTVEDTLRKLQYDLYYVRHQSLALDLVIMVRTINIMLTFQGT